jgi:hypothetical protein
MSIDVFNRLRILEERVAALEQLLATRHEPEKNKACEEKPHTLSLRKKA